MDANYKPYKRYENEFKRNAVELLESSGRPISEVAGDLGIPYKTLERWRGRFRKRVCEATGISRSGYYAHLKKPEQPLRKGDQELKPKIRQVFDKSRGTYGTPRVCIELGLEGVSCGRRRIGRLMREQSLKARNKRQWRRGGTTQTDPALATAPNHLRQIPRPDGPNQVWVGDITYLPTRQGWPLPGRRHRPLFAPRRRLGHLRQPGDTPIITKALQ